MRNETDFGRPNGLDMSIVLLWFVTALLAFTGVYLRHAAQQEQMQQQQQEEVNAAEEIDATKVEGAEANKSDNSEEPQGAIEASQPEKGERNGRTSEGC